MKENLIKKLGVAGKIKNKILPEEDKDVIAEKRKIRDNIQDNRKLNRKDLPNYSYLDRYKKSK